MNFATEAVEEEIAVTASAPASFGAAAAAAAKDGLTAVNVSVAGTVTGEDGEAQAYSFSASVHTVGSKKYATRAAIAEALGKATWSDCKISYGLAAMPWGFNGGKA